MDLGIKGATETVMSRKVLHPNNEEKDGKILPIPGTPDTTDDAWDKDLVRLQKLGYKQELKRHLSLSSSFAFSVSMISVVTGITTLYNTGLTYGGPMSATVGWIVVATFNTCIGVSMAEICSAYPTSGGLYWWSAKLANEEWAPLASWVTGWYVRFSLNLCLHARIWAGVKLYNTGLTYGGPMSATVGWIVVATFNTCIGMSMAEICSAYPTSGGLYWWSAKLANEEWAPLASWVTGWFIIVGQCATTTSVDFSLAELLQVIILLSTGGKNGGGYLASKYVVMGFHGGILLIHGLLNCLPITRLSRINEFGALWNGIGLIALTILIPIVAPQKADAKFVLTHFNKENDAGIHSNVYIFVFGLLMSQYTLSGYDVSVHMSEETKNAEKNGPMAIVTAVITSAILGWAYLLAITVAVTASIPYLLSEDNDAGGYAIAEVFYLIFKQRYGSGVGGIICVGIIAVALFFCGISLVADVYRITYAFSRDGAMPLSSVWNEVSKHNVPVNAVWLCVFVAFSMALTSLGSMVAFEAMASIATIGVYIAYALPIFFRVTLGRKSFTPGPFNLGRYGILVGWISILWVAMTTFLFSLPVSYPITKETLNYTPIALGVFLVVVLSSWLLSARHWFKGPIAMSSPSAECDEQCVVTAHVVH